MRGSCLRARAIQKGSGTAVRVSMAKRANRLGPPQKQGLYDPAYEHDACGLGFVVDIKGRKSHRIVQQALEVLGNLDHRGACGCEANTGDGAGVLMQMPHRFLAEACRKARVALPEAGRLRLRPGVPAAQPHAAAPDRGAVSGTSFSPNGPDAAGLAHRADRQHDAGRNRQASEPLHAPGVHRPRPRAGR